MGRERPVTDEEWLGNAVELLGAIIRTSAVYRFQENADEIRPGKEFPRWRKLSEDGKKAALMRAWRWWQECEPLSDDDWRPFQHSHAAGSGHD